MAKRKRLTPAKADYLDLETKSALGPDFARAPIAQIAGDSAAAAALQEVSGELTRAEEEGRLIRTLPVSMVDMDYLVRDRITADPDALNELKASLKARGQRTPIEVVALPEGVFGLISGWRRLLALQAIGESEVLALVRAPQSSSDAYIAMVEENEIREGLSQYEKARIVLRSVGAGVFESEKAALKGLFPHASYSKRSKIKSFIPVVEALDGVLRWPMVLNERTGLALSKALAEDEGFAPRFIKALKEYDFATRAEELGVIEAALKPAPKEGKTESNKAKTPKRDGLYDTHLIAPGIRIGTEAGKIYLEGQGVNAGLTERLKDFLRTQG